MPKLLYVTDGIFPGVVGGLQKVSAYHLEMLKNEFDITVVYSGNDITNKLENITYIHEKWPKLKKIPLTNNYPRELKAYSVAIQHHIENIKPDVIYTEGPFLYSYLLARARHIVKQIPVIYHTHGLGAFQKGCSLVESFKASFLKGIIKFHSLAADGVISQGGKLNMILQNDIGVEKDKIIELNNFVHERHIEHAIKTKGEKEYDLIFVGRPDKNKGLSLLLTALEGVDQAMHICLIGDSSGKKYLTDSVHKVVSVGEIKNENELSNYYQKSKFLILPSYIEGMPTVVLEAMAQGVPAISSKVGAIEKVISSDEDGFLFEKGDRESLEHALKQALAMSEDEYHTMSEHVVIKIKTDFSYQKVKADLISAISKLL